MDDDLMKNRETIYTQAMASHVKYGLDLRMTKIQTNKCQSVDSGWAKWNLIVN